MYHPASIASLTPSQISKALKGLPVRVSAGNQHSIELSQEQLKKLSKAAQKGKASTITLDPFQIQKHMSLLGSGVGRRNKYNQWVDTLGARDLIDAGMNKGATTISGSGVGRRNKYNQWVDALGARDLIDAGMTRGATTISGSGVGRRNKYNQWVDTLGARDLIDAGMTRGASSISGSGVGRRNKYNQWVDTLGARDLIDAGMTRGASSISGTGVMQDLYARASQKDARKAINKHGPDFSNDVELEDEYYGYGVGRRNKYNKWVDALGARQVIDAGMSKGASSISGFGLKKRGRPRKTGGALYVAGKS
jgi:hypothetical protein